jgi:hypothetical protein
VREGLHNKVNTTEGGLRQLRTKVGDLGVWSRAYVLPIWRQSVWPDEAIREAEAIGLRLRNAPAEIVSVEGLGRNVDYMPIPY